MKRILHVFCFLFICLYCTWSNAFGIIYPNVKIILCSYVPTQDNNYDIAFLMKYSPKKQIWQTFGVKKNCYNKKILNTCSWLKNEPINDKHPLDVALRSWLILPQQYQSGIKDLLTKSYYNGFYSHQFVDVFNNSVFVSCFFIPVPFIATKDFSSNLESQKTAAYEWVTFKEICKGAKTFNPFYSSLDQHMIQLNTMDVFIISDPYRHKIFLAIEQELKKQNSAQHNEELKFKDPFDITSLISKSGEHSLKLFANIEPEVVILHTDQ